VTRAPGPSPADRASGRGDPQAGPARRRRPAGLRVRVGARAGLGRRGTALSGITPPGPAGGPVQPCKRHGSAASAVVASESVRPGPIKFGCNHHGDARAAGAAGPSLSAGPLPGRASPGPAGSAASESRPGFPVLLSALQRACVAKLSCAVPARPASESVPQSRCGRGRRPGRMPVSNRPPPAACTK
jgi:hypothetical protein